MERPSQHLPPLVAAFLLGIAVCSVVGLVSAAGLLTSLEWLGYDLIIAVRGPKPPSQEVVVVDFDDASVRARNAFPIPRRLLADALERVGSGQPSVIGLDVLLDQKRADEDDRQLAQTIERLGNVVLVSEYGFGRQRRSEPLPEFVTAAAGTAFGDLPLDDDGSVRRMHLQLVTPDFQGLSFPVALASYHSEQRLTVGGEGYRMFGLTRVPLISTAPDSALIRYRNAFPAQVVTLDRLLDPGFDPAIFRGRIVVVGQSSEFAKDLFSTPAFHFRPPVASRARLSGAEIHAAAASTLLAEAVPARMSRGWLWTANLVLSFLLITAVLRLRPAGGVGVMVLAATAILAAATHLLDDYHLWMPFVSSEACVALSLPAGLGYRFLDERRQKRLAEAERRQLMGLFERYVSPEVAAEIWRRRGEIVLAGEERTVTVLFSDIRNFTALTAGRPSAEVLVWLNQYLAAMSEVVRRNGGFLNKFIGDGIMVVFGAPLSAGPQEDAWRAVETAREMLTRVEQLNAQLTDGQPRLKIGVGIHTGPVTAGNVGSPERLEYSVIGETVNLASRLESLTKEFGTGIVLSPATWEMVRDRMPTVTLGEAEVRGFPQKIRLYSVSPTEAAS